MSKMIEVKVADLIGPALDWAVGSALGWVCYPEDSIEYGNTWHMGGDRAPFGPVIRVTDWRPSTDWAQGGPLLDKYTVTLVRNSWPGATDPVTADCLAGFGDNRMTGRTRLEAACRSIVAAKLGDVVSVPAELVQGGAE